MLEQPGVSSPGDREDLMHDIICITPDVTELDLVTAPRLRRRLLALEAPAEVIMDMRAVELCDARGIGALIAGWNYQWRRGGTLQLSGTRPYVEHILTLAGAMHVFARPCLQ
jgi:anti-anti-sigma factor